MRRAKTQPSPSAKNLLQTVCSHDGLRGLLGHIAHAAKTGGCHSPLLYSTLLMVLACRLWRHNMITHHLSTTLVHTTLSAQCILTPRLCTHVCPTHNSLTHTHFPTHVLDTQHFCTHSCPTPLFHPQHFHTHDFSHTTFTRNFFTHLTSTRISCTHRSFTISFLFPASPIPFSIIFTFLWPLIGRN